MYVSEAFPDITFENENSKVYADYWVSLPKVDSVPLREVFDPRDLKSILPTFEIHDMRHPERVEVRLSGTELADRYGVDITGTNYLDIVDPKR